MSSFLDKVKKDEEKRQKAKAKKRTTPATFPAGGSLLGGKRVKSDAQALADVKKELEERKIVYNELDEEVTKLEASLKIKTELRGNQDGGEAIGYGVPGDAKYLDLEQKLNAIAVKEKTVEDAKGKAAKRGKRKT